MPAERRNPQTKPFKPQHPKSVATTTGEGRQPGSTTRLPPAGNRSKTGRKSGVESEPEADLEPSASGTASSLPAIAMTGDSEPPHTASIPRALLTRLLHEHFQDASTRISKGADSAIAKYMDTFVREAIARAAFERAEAGIGEDFLELEDLEKLAPQLVLDF